MNHIFTFKEDSKPKKHLDKYINNCNVTNIKKLREELKKYCKEPLFIEKYKNSLKELIQILFKYLLDRKKNLKEDIFGSFKDEEIFLYLKKLYYIEDCEINCTMISSLSLLIINTINSKPFLYFLLSNNFVNDLMIIDYEKYNDEFFSFYINFLKSLTMRLDNDTAPIFYIQKFNYFPLIDCVTNLYNYTNAMTRTVANNIILQILKKNIYLIHEHCTKLPTVNYFCFFSLRMKDLLLDCINNNKIKLIDEFLDSILFLNDLLSLNINIINYMFINSLFHFFIIPEILINLYNNTSGNKNEEKYNTNKIFYMFIFLIVILNNIKHKTFINILINLLLNEYTFSDVIIPYYLDNKNNLVNNYYFYNWKDQLKNKKSFYDFICLNYSIEFIYGFTNINCVYYKQNTQAEENKIYKYYQIKLIKTKSEEISQRIAYKPKDKDNLIQELNNFILKLFDEKPGKYKEMKEYHENISKIIGINVGLSKNVDYEINKCCFLWNYKIWADSENKNNEKNNKKLLIEYLSYDDNINEINNYTIIVLNNILIWVILNHHINDKSINNNKNDTNNNGIKMDDGDIEINNMFKGFNFDIDYLINKILFQNCDNSNHLLIIQKICLILESISFLSFIKLNFLEIICHNLSVLCLANNKENNNDEYNKIIISNIKNIYYKLISLLSDNINNYNSNIKDNSKEALSFNETILNSLYYIMNNNCEIEAKIKRLLKNITNILIKINEDNNKNEFDIINNISYCISSLLILLQNINKKIYTKVLFKKESYILDDIQNDYDIIYKNNNEIIFIEKLFIYYGKINNDEEVVINEIFLCKKYTKIKKEEPEHIKYYINDKVMVKFINDEKGKNDMELFEQKLNNINNINKDISLEIFNDKNMIEYLNKN